MNRVLCWMVLAVAVGGPAAAQGTPPPGPDKAQLEAFGKAFSVTRRAFVDDIPAKTLIARASHGLATAPLLQAPAQKRVIAAALAQVGLATGSDIPPMLRAFGSAVDALHTGAGAPALDAILRAAASGMLDGLDSQTRFLPPAPASDTAGEGSAGLALTLGPDGPSVVRAYPSGPAAQAGVQRGDEVLSIDGHPTKDLRLDEVTALLRGPAGSTATLVVRRGAGASPATIGLTRAVVRIAAVYGRNLEGVAYLNVAAFVPGTAQALHRLLTELRDHAGSPVRGVVLDLRDNTGGRFTEAVAVADELLPAATPIAAIAGRDAGVDKRFTAAAGDMAAGLPMVVLVNQASAAGSEVVAAALQNGRGAVVMGGHTAGSGLVASIVPLPPLGAMRLTTGHIVLPSGQTLKPPGLLPQVALAPELAGPSGAPVLETPSIDPTIVRLRRGIPQTPQAGQTFDAPDAPERDFEVQQARSAIAMLTPGAVPQP